ncbi:MAG: iron ABC transporter permease [Lachnospiraceae bacterium]|nr:iron ABC transporter permease [Lachnospiraceae bacterium]
MIKRSRVLMGFIILALLVLVLFVINIGCGSVSLSWSQILSVLSRSGMSDKAYMIVWNIRIPRVIAAFVLGGALAIAGLMLQTFFSNPIAGPYVLGISSGAKLVVALTMIFFLGRGITLSSGALIVAAFIGSLICMGFILLVSSRVRRMSLLVICGVMLGYICTAITDFVVAFADDSDIVNLHNWSMGSFSGITWNNVSVMIVVVGVALVLSMFLAKPMDAYRLGEEYASNLGVNVKLFRVMLILISSILAATVTAFAGPVSFVGIAVPHLMKRLFGYSKPIIMVPACFMGGAVFCLFSDLVARTIFAPTEISISSVTAILGAPIVIMMLIGRKREVNE